MQTYKHNTLNKTFKIILVKQLNNKFLLKILPINKKMNQRTS